MSILLPNWVKIASVPQHLTRFPGCGRWCPHALPAQDGSLWAQAVGTRMGFDSHQVAAGVGFHAVLLRQVHVCLRCRGGQADRACVGGP